MTEPPLCQPHHPSISPMGEQTLSDTPSTQSLPLPESTTTATTATTTATATTTTTTTNSSSQDLSLPTSSSTITTTVVAAATKIRPRKLRKLSLDDESAPKPSPTTATKTIALRTLPRPLSADGEIDAALRHLRAADPHISRVIDSHKPPSFESLHPPFHALARSILYQQLAFKAATSIYSRFLSLCGGDAGVLPDAVLALTPQHLRQIGVSERKASYLHDLARKYHSGILSDAAIVNMDDKSLFSMLTMVKGIGAWSVHMFMIFSLHRPDVLPVGDVGVRKGVQILYGLEDLPRPSQMEKLCERWRPYRSVGSWYMWRLIENNGAPTLASSETPSVGGGVQQKPLFIDPIQVLPNLG